MKRWIGGGLALLVSGLAQAGGSQNMSMVERSGDVLQVGVPVLALGLTFLLDEPGGEEKDKDKDKNWSEGITFDPLRFDGLRLNGSPRHDLALAFARTELVTYGLKYSVNAERPNGSPQSFPSGHTSAAFAGAEFIRKQYGPAWGVPAYLLAGFVGWSRVASNNHYPRDVIAGAAIGILSNHDFASVNLPFGTLSISTGLLETQPGFISGFDAPPVDSVAAGFRPPPGMGLRFELRF